MRRRRRISEYGIRFREKQRAKRYYGMYERPFRNFFQVAAQSPANTGVRFLTMLESRLDNVIYRAGLARSRPHARQLTRHGHVRVNGRRLNIPSSRVRPDDVIAVAGGERIAKLTRAVMEETRSRPVPSWLEVDPKALNIRVLQTPLRQEVPIELREQLIVELMSR
jgi:small subunit ribosomal protein S4